MADFWNSGSGAAITGNPSDAFVKDFSIIPEGTIAEACIKQFLLVDKENKHTGVQDKFYMVTYKLLNGDYKSQEVTQKIKCFNGKPEAIDRNLNMLRLVMQLCEFKPTHNNAPQDIELVFMVGKVVCIKVGEWSMSKQDGSGSMEGNFVREVHASGALAAETGVKAVVTSKPTDSALTRNAKMPELDSDLPF